MSRPDVKQPTFEDLELLAEVSQLLTLMNLDEVLQKVINLAAKAVGATSISLFLHEGQTVDWDHIFTARNLSLGESIPVVRRVLDEGLAGWVYRKKQGAIIFDTEEDDRWITFPDDTLSVRSALCVPFMRKEQAIAVVTLTHPDPHHFALYHLRLMTIVANQASVAIYNTQLFNRIQHLFDRIKGQQRQLEGVLQAIGDVLIVLDDKGCVMMVNDAALSLLGDADREINGQHLSKLAETDTAFAPIAEIINTGNKSTHWSLEVRSEVHQKDLQVTMSMWKDETRDIAGYVIVMHDVTMLRDLHRFKDEMLRIAGHDLRSPLALIIGYADMISLDTPDENSPVHEYLRVIHSSTERMNGLLEDLLRVERVRSSPLELHEETDLSKLVKVVLVNMRLAAEAKRQKFDSKLVLDGIPGIVADPVLIRQAMENLIGNAVKYTPEGGTVIIHANHKDGKFHFIVQDTGIGIAEEHLSRVFESFYRVRESAGQHGSGLGLNLVKTVIERHGGKVWVESEVGVGSRFGFWLPLGVDKS